MAVSSSPGRRTYVTDIPGGNATTSIQFVGNGTLESVIVTMTDAAVGELEISTIPTSQIGTIAPTKDVLARIKNGATAAYQFITLDLSALKLKVTTLGYLYFHQTGAGNVGSVTVIVS